MISEIKRIGKKHIDKDGKLVWDDFEEEMTPLLNKKMELYKYIERYEKKQQINICRECGSIDIYPVKRKRRTGQIYKVMRCNRCGTCNLGVK